MPRLKTNDGIMVDTGKATVKYQGEYKKGKVSQVLLYDPVGGYYLVDRINNSVEWYCDELAIKWLKANGIWNLPENLK